jgi:hypothetical protein
MAVLDSQLGRTDILRCEGGGLVVACVIHVARKWSRRPMHAFNHVRRGECA